MPPTPNLEEIPMPPKRWMRVEEEYFKRLQELERKVIYALQQQGDDVCWKDLYNEEVAALVGVKFDPALLPKERHMANCNHFYDCLAADRPYTPVVTISTLADLLSRPLDELRRTLSDRQAAYNALGSSGAGTDLIREIKRLEIAVRNHPAAQ